MSSLGGAQNIVSLKNVDQSFVVGEETIDVLHDINFELQANTFNIIYGPLGLVNQLY